jgi:hypothetical protein
MHRSAPFTKLVPDLERLKSVVKDQQLATELLERFAKLQERQRQPAMFWPPRLGQAYDEDRLVPFLGAGISIAAGMPGWGKLLKEHLQLASTFTEDDELKSDALTLAEIASERMGSEKVQDQLRELLDPLDQFTTTHVVLASLRCRYYITTNYDSLLEKAWKRVLGLEMNVVTNDFDLANLGVDWREYDKPGSALLFKIHGCHLRQDEHLILTRRDYRHHYRANHQFFEAIRALLAESHILFAGFSHRDPEVTRLVEDAIFAYERASTTNSTQPKRPHFYSLQFDMWEHTPEIFAARGLVALRPTFVHSDHDPRSLSLASALGELAHDVEHSLYQARSLDQDLQALVTLLESKLKKAAEAMESQRSELVAAARRRARRGPGEPQHPACLAILSMLGELADQGVYLANEEGDLIDCALPPGLAGEERLRTLGNVTTRPYFRAAKTFRRPFVSDSFPSRFNENSTIAIGLPLIEKSRFMGLVFAATHPGQWRFLLDALSQQYNLGRSLFLMDSDGILLLPPNQEFTAKERASAIPGEAQASNTGFLFRDLKRLSRLDALVRHLVHNIVPLSQDDDVFEVAPDLEIYSVVANVFARWKLAISQPRDK